MKITAIKSNSEATLVLDIWDWECGAMVGFVSACLRLGSATSVLQCSELSIPMAVPHAEAAGNSPTA